MSVYLGTQKVQVYAGTDAVRVFAGRPDYLIFRGKLVWADPKIYLQSGNYSYIDTGFKAQDFSKIECTYQLVGTGNFISIFGGRNGSSDKELDFRKLYSEANPRWRFGYNSNAYYYSVSADYNWQDKYTMRYENGAVYLNDTAIITGISQTSFTGDYNVFLFGCNSGGSLHGAGYGTQKIYRARFWANDVLVRDFVPVPSGLVIGNTTISANGMFDMVTQTPYYNVGTGSFTYGKDN